MAEEKLFIVPMAVLEREDLLKMQKHCLILIKKMFAPNSLRIENARINATYLFIHSGLFCTNRSKFAKKKFVLGILRNVTKPGQHNKENHR